MGQTEEITNNLNLSFNKKIDIAYNFTEVQQLKFVVHDIDNETAKLSDDDFLGL